MRIKDIVFIGMMSAILLVLQVSLGFLPNIELVSLLILLYTLVYGKKTILIIYVFVLLEGFIYGWGLWWINYLYVWLVLYLIAIIQRNNKSTIFWALVSGLYGLGFGALCSIPYFFIGGSKTALAYWVSGIPFDITHGISNFIIALVLFKPLYLLLQYVSRHKETIL